MYRKKDELQILIDTMSPVERRYFIHFSTYLGKKNDSMYIDLFEQLQKGIAPNVKSTSAQGLVIAKRTLYKNILRSLTSYNVISIDAQLDSMVSAVKILYDKNLLDQSARLLYKAKDEAIKNEKYGVVIQLLEWERKISALTDIPSRTITQIAEEEQMITSCLNNIFDFERLFSKTIEYKRKYGYIRGDFTVQFNQEMIHHPLLTAESNCFSQRARYYFYHTKALSHFMVFGYEKSYEYSKKLLSVNRNIIPLHDYLNGILHHSTSCICLGLFDETLEYLNVSQSLIAEKQLDLFNILSLKVFYYRSNYEMVCYMYQGKTEMTIRKIQEIEESFIRFKDRIPLEMKQVITSSLRNGYMCIGLGTHVNRLVNEMQNEESKNTRNDIYDDHMLFRLIWLIKDKAYEIIPSVALSSYRYYSGYKNAHSKYSLELKIVKLFMKKCDFTKQKERNNLLLKIKDAFDAYIKELNPATEFLEHCSYYLIWINSMIKGNEFAEEAKIWYKQHIDKVNLKISEA